MRPSFKISIAYLRKNNAQSVHGKATDENNTNSLVSLSLLADEVLSRNLDIVKVDSVG